MIILVPIIRSEISQLLTWLSKLLPPFGSGDNDHIVFSIDDSWGKEEVVLITRRLETCNLHNLKPSFVSCSITSSQSVYIKNNIDRKPTPELLLGKKSGPNLQFFISLRKCVELFESKKALSPLLLCEVDTVPLHHGWGADLVSLAFRLNKNFLVAGAKAADPWILGKVNRDRFNGNAIYNLKNEKITEFLDLWEFATRFVNSIDSCVAYDCVKSWICYWLKIKNTRMQSGVTDLNKLGKLSGVSEPEDVSKFVELYQNGSADLSALIFNDNSMRDFDVHSANLFIHNLKKLHSIVLYHGWRGKLINGQDLFPEKLVSIVTIVLNDSIGLIRTIDSVRDFTLNQSALFEFIVVDGGSTDDTLNVIESNLDVITSYSSERDDGIYDAMNKGVTLSSGLYVVFMNAGDCFSNEIKLDEILSFENYGVADVIYGDRYYICNNDIKYQKAKDISHLNEGMCFGHQSAFFNRELLVKMRFNSMYKYAADYDQIVRIFVSNATFSYMEKPICAFYCGGRSESGPRPYLEAIKIQFDNFSKEDVKKSRYLKALIGNVQSIFKDYV